MNTVFVKLDKDFKKYKSTKRYSKFEENYGANISFIKFEEKVFLSILFKNNIRLLIKKSRVNNNFIISAFFGNKNITKRIFKDWHSDHKDLGGALSEKEFSNLNHSMEDACILWAARIKNK